MKALLLIVSVILMTGAAQASTPKLSIAETKRILAGEFLWMLRGDELSDSATCEEIDLFFESHYLVMNDLESGLTQTAKDAIDCVSSK